MLSIFAEFVQACSKQRLSILNTNLENIQYHTSALPVASHSSLIEHNKQHSIKETCPFEKCGKTFIRKQLLADHINSHTGVKPYSCDKCKKTFVSQSSYSHHKSNCMKRIKCEEYGNVFSTKSVLYDHVNSKHEVQWFVCNCDKHYRWRTNLARHRKNCSV